MSQILTNLYDGKVLPNLGVRTSTGAVMGNEAMKAVAILLESLLSTGFDIRDTTFGPWILSI